jgi:hypothetical protein
MSEVLHSYLRCRAVSPKECSNFFYSAKKTKHHQLFNTARSSIYWRDFYSLHRKSMSVCLGYVIKLVPSLHQILCFFKSFSSNCPRHIPKLRNCISLICIENMQKWNEMLFSLLLCVTDNFLLFVFFFRLLS